MRRRLVKEPRALALAEQALRNLGRTPKLSIVRGGTDGSRFTELGLPTPNLSTRRAQSPLAVRVDEPRRNGSSGGWDSWSW